MGSSHDTAMGILLAGFLLMVLGGLAAVLLLSCGIVFAGW